MAESPVLPSGSVVVLHPTARHHTGKGPLGQDLEVTPPRTQLTAAYHFFYHIRRAHCAVSWQGNGSSSPKTLEHPPHPQQHRHAPESASPERHRANLGRIWRAGSYTSSL